MFPPLNESEDQGIEVGAEEVGRAMSKPIVRGLTTATISLAAEKLIEYSIVALVIIAAVGGLTVYVIVKRKDKKKEKTVKQVHGIKAQTVKPKIKHYRY